MKYSQHVDRCLRLSAMIGLLTATMAASEHRGQVHSGGLPVPGATVTATQGDRKVLAITDAKGVYTFADLSDGTWRFQVEMLCFATIDREVVIGPGAEEAIWDLKLLPFAEIQASAGPVPSKLSSTEEKRPPTISTGPVPVQRQPTAENRRAKSRDSKAAAEMPAPNPQSGFQRADLNASAESSTLS